MKEALCGKRGFRFLAGPGILMPMSATITATAGLAGVSPTSAIAESFRRVWLDARGSFRAWERRHIELAKPDEKTLAQYRDALKWKLWRQA
jgi:hypothetical protein